MSESSSEDEAETAALMVAVNQSYNAQVAEKSRATYRASQTKYLMWLNSSESLHVHLGDAFKAGLRAAIAGAESNAKAQRAAATRYIHQILTPPVDLSRPPLKFSSFQGEYFTMWVTNLTKDNKPSEKPGFSTLNGHRAALFNLFRDFKINMSPALEAHLQGVFRGVKRVRAQDAQAGSATVKVGKDPMTFSLYRFICGQLLMKGTGLRASDFTISHSMLTLSWNLMCRVNNTTDIKLDHLEWVEDALVVYFGRMKNDQSGDRSGEGRHVYANPLQPECCAILALALYWCIYPPWRGRAVAGSGGATATVGPVSGGPGPALGPAPPATGGATGGAVGGGPAAGGHGDAAAAGSGPALAGGGDGGAAAAVGQLPLFPGTKQDNRFQDCLIERVLKSPEGLVELARIGSQPGAYGTHSVRKGAATFASSGSTACPSMSAIQNRAGWSMGKVMDIYLRYEAAGDQYVGRTVAGLPQFDVQFATLPPHFVNSPESDTLVAVHIKDVFGSTLPPRLYLVARFALASLVYHQQFLRAKLPPSHTLFTTLLFREPLRLQALARHVRCGVAPPHGAPMHTTGVPPHVLLLGQFSQVFERFGAIEGQLSEVIVSIPAQVRQAVADELEHRALQSGTITRDNLISIFREFGLSETIARLDRLETGGPLPAAAAAAPPPTPATVQPRMFSLNGRFIRLPPDFRFPSMTTLSAWQLWWLGDPSHEIPPIWQVIPNDIPGDTTERIGTRKRLSDMRFLMTALDQAARGDQTRVWPSTPTVAADVNEMFDCAVQRLGFLNDGSRVAQHAFMTTVRKLRSAKKAASHAAQAGQPSIGQALAAASTAPAPPAQS